MEDRKKAGATTKRPEPAAFTFRPKFPSESESEYQAIRAGVRGGRGSALKGMLKKKLDAC